MVVYQLVVWRPFQLEKGEEEHNTTVLLSIISL